MALACTWGGYADTDIEFSAFFSANHTIAVRFMLQYPNAYEGPMVSVQGTGTLVLGQGDFLANPSGQQKLILRVGSGQINPSVQLASGTWHHLAAVRSGSTYTLYLDGTGVGTLPLSGSGLPSGKLRLGKDTFDAALDAGGRQFYGLLDDVAIFTAALPASEIQALASAQHLTGTEQNLLAGYTFGSTPPGGLPAKLARPLIRTPAASIRTVSSNRNAGDDVKQLPLPLTDLMHLPFPEGESIYVIQGFDNPGGSHKGYASFCCDFMLAGHPQSDSDGKPFHAAAPGLVDFVKEDAAEGGATNFISVKQADHAFCDYLHLKQNSALVKVGDPVGFGDHLADIGDTGAAVGAFHLHIAVTNLGEGKKSSGGAFVTIPAPFCNFEASDDGGSTWHQVLRGVPKQGQWVRRYVTPDPVRYTAVWRPSTEGEIQVYGWTYADYRARYDELWNQGWRLKLLSVYVEGGQPRYTAVWRPSTEGEIQVYGWTYEDYRARYDELWNQGWRLKLLSVYVEGGQPRYTAVWRPSTEGEIQVYGWTYEDYRARYDVLWDLGWRLGIVVPSTP